MLRILLFLALIFLWFRILSPSRRRQRQTQRVHFWSQFFRSPNFNTSQGFDSQGSENSSAHPKIIDDIKPCQQCSTYSPATLAVKENNLYFCSRECQKLYQKEKS